MIEELSDSEEFLIWVLRSFDFLGSYHPSEPP